MKSNINRGDGIVTCVLNLTSLNIADEKKNLASKYFFPKNLHARFIYLMQSDLTEKIIFWKGSLPINIICDA